MRVFPFIKADDGENLSKQKIVRFKSPLSNNIILVISAEENGTWEKWYLFKYSVTIRTNMFTNLKLLWVMYRWGMYSATMGAVISN